VIWYRLNGTAHRYKVVEVTCNTAKLRLVANNKPTGEPIEMGDTHEGETSPASAAINLVTFGADNVSINFYMHRTNLVPSLARDQFLPLVAPLPRPLVRNSSARDTDAR
jgi:hypothetical protein